MKGEIECEDYDDYCGGSINMKETNGHTNIQCRDNQQNDKIEDPDDEGMNYFSPSLKKHLTNNQASGYITGDVRYFHDLYEKNFDQNKEIQPEGL